MTPAARVAAAIEVLDAIFAGDVAEKALTGWGRSHRFAGSKDRAAIRDHVFQALRCRASYGWLGGAQTGRGVMIGAMRAAGSVDDMFTGVGHAPGPVEPEEAGAPLGTAPRDVRLDMPDWLLPHFDEVLGEETDAVLALMQQRANVFLRVNLARTTREEAARVLDQDGIKTAFMQNVSSALQVIENERRVVRSAAYLNGLVELQDTSSQAAMEMLEVSPGLRVLDYCAGGGGKALALAARGADVTAHDIDAKRMKDIAPRAARAGVDIRIIETRELTQAAPFDLVLCDAPCSGSGTWRRSPQAKWDFTPERLAELTVMQDDVLAKAAPLVSADGVLAYATCSCFKIENSARIQSLIQNPDWDIVREDRWLPGLTQDGFYLAQLRRQD